MLFHRWAIYMGENKIGKKPLKDDGIIIKIELFALNIIKFPLILIH